MSAELGKYLRGLLSRKATAYLAVIVSKITPDVYTVRLIDTKGVIRATRKNPSIEYVKDQIVSITFSDGSGRTRNTEPLIDGLGNSTTHNASVNQEYESAPIILAAAVSVISPNPCALVHGGAAVTVTIRGVNFTVAPTYSNAGITDNVAAVVTSTLITINPKAGGGLAPGLYDLTIEPGKAWQKTVPRFFVVT